MCAPADLFDRFPATGKTDKGLIRDYLIKVSGFSRAQVTRLIQKLMALLTFHS